MYKLYAESTRFSQRELVLCSLIHKSKRDPEGMKSCMDNAAMSKRPAISPRIESTGQAQGSTATNMQGKTTSDALSYLKTVRESFEDNIDKYNEFLDVMKAFKAQRIDTTGVISKVKELFEGNRNLILGFNAFLPKGCEITLPPEDEPFLRRKPVEFNEALDFVNRIRTRFLEDDHVFKAFLDILNMHRNNNKSIREVYQEVSVLFQDHPDILVEFTHFLPDTSAPTCVRNQPDRNHTQYREDRDSPMAIAGPIHVDKKPTVSHAVCDHFANQPVLNQRNSVDKEKENEEGKDKNELGSDDGLDRKKIFAHQDDDSVTVVQDPELAFHDKVNGRIQDPESCKKISDYIRNFKSKFYTAAHFRTMVTGLIGAHPDLMDACEEFIIYIEKTGSMRTSRQVFKSSKVDEDVDCDMAGKNKDKEPDIGERDAYDRGPALNTKDIPGQKLSSYGSRDNLTKPIQELDLSNCESCTPSYRLLPENIIIPPASRKTEIGDQVLNDRWVSVTSGSEDYSFKHMRKNQYEESLFRCEDDRFELDMLLETANTTVKRIEELLNSMNGHTNSTDGTFHIEDHLTALDIRCIERLYGDHGVDVMEVLRKNALLSLPIIFSRLKQKQEEWFKCRTEFNKIWAETYAKNYHKSLDHRSFYFKQQDTKNLSAKALLAEIKEISEKNHSEDEIVLIAGAATKKPKKPHMDFEYTDPDIQDDLYHLIKYSCGEICSPEQRDKVMKIWTTFLEPMLGVPSHPPNAEGKKESVEAENYRAKNRDNIGEKTGSLTNGAAYLKPSNTLRSSDECISTEHPCSSRALLSHGNFGAKSDCSHGGDIVTKIDVHGSAPTDSSTMSAMLWAGRQVGFVESSPNTAREKSTNEENASARNKEPSSGPERNNATSEMEAMACQKSKDGGVIRRIASSIALVPEDAKIQVSHVASEVHCKTDREEGELSPRKDLEEKMISACANLVTQEQALCKVDPSTRRKKGEEICDKEVREETEVNANDEGDESAHGTSESENVSENGDVSASESPNAEECSPEEPDEDGDNEENVNKAEPGVEADGMVDAHDAEGILPFSDRFLQTVKPLTMKTPMPHHGKVKNSRIFYGNDSFYLLFRFHQILYARMKSAKVHASSSENKWRILNNAHPADSYARFKDALCSLLNGSSDNAKFEDECRAIIGAHSYVLFTLDKLIHKLIKQLQTIATDEMDNKLLQLYAYERSRSHGTFNETVYHQNACFLVPEDNLYRIECFPCPTHLTIQHMKNEQDKLDPKATFMDPKFEAYLNSELLSAVPGRRKGRAKVSMKRDMRDFLSGEEASDFQRAMEGVVVRNGLEMRVNCSTLKISYVVGTEDSFYRIKKKKKNHNNFSWHQFLSSL